MTARNMPCRHTAGVDVRLYSFLTLALDGCVRVCVCVGGQRHAPAALPPRKRHATHCTGGCMGPQDRSEQVWRGDYFLRQPGSNPPAIQWVAGCYTDSAVRMW